MRRLVGKLAAWPMIGLLLGQASGSAWAFPAMPSTRAMDLPASRKLLLGSEQRGDYPVSVGQDLPAVTGQENTAPVSMSGDLLPGLPSGFAAEAVQGSVAGSRAPATRPADDPVSSHGGEAASRGGMRSGNRLPSDPSVSSAMAPGRVLFPFRPGTGAVAFRRANAFYIFFASDAAVALPNDPAFAGATIGRSGDAISVRVPLTAGQSPTLCHLEEGWLLSLDGLQTCRGAAAIEPHQDYDRLELPVGGATEVIRAFDPDSQTPILLGPLAADQGGGISETIHSSVGVVLPTAVGVLFEPWSDSSRLIHTREGYAVTPWSLPMAAHGPSLATVMTRSLNLPQMDMQAARLRLEQARHLAAVSSGASSDTLLEAAQAALAAGDGFQAGYFARLAEAREATGGAGQARLVATLARIVDHDGAADPGLSIPGHSDEIRAWRAYLNRRDAANDPELCDRLLEAAALFAAYPAPLRHLLWPQTAETYASCATPTQLARFDPSDWSSREQFWDGLRLARAIVAARRANKPTLVPLDALTRDADPVVAYRAQMLALPAHVGRREITPAQAADRLDFLVFAARMAGEQAAWRDALLSLRFDAGELDQALQLALSSSANSPPPDSLLAKLLHRIAAATPDGGGGGATEASRLLRSIKILSMVEDRDGALHEVLAKALLRAGLPARAGDLVENAATLPDTKHQLERLDLQIDAYLQAGNAKKAADLLDAMTSTTKSPDDLSHLHALQVRSLRALGDCARVSSLTAGEVHDPAQLSDPDSDRFAGDCMARAGNWAGAEGPLLRAASQIPAGSSPLSRADETTIAQLATAASHLDDAATLKRVDNTFANRVDQRLRPALSVLTHGSKAGSVAAAAGTADKT